MFSVKKLAKFVMYNRDKINIQIHFFSTCRLVYFLTVHSDNVQDGVLQANPKQLSFFGAPIIISPIIIVINLKIEEN